MMNDRFGKFRIYDRESSMAKDCGYLDLLVSAIFAGKLVVRCEHLFSINALEYTAHDLGCDF